MRSVCVCVSVFMRTYVWLCLCRCVPTLLYVSVCVFVWVCVSRVRTANNLLVLLVLETSPVNDTTTAVSDGLQLWR